MLCAPEKGARPDMSLARCLSIRNFRAIVRLDWAQCPGFDAIIGPGDSVKSTVLEAPDLVPGARGPSEQASRVRVGRTAAPIRSDGPDRPRTASPARGTTIGRNDAILVLSRQ
jgi:hypothetical protein